VVAIAALCLVLLGTVVISSAREEEQEMEQRALEPDLVPVDRVNRRRSRAWAR